MTKHTKEAYDKIQETITALKTIHRNLQKIKESLQATIDEIDSIEVGNIPISYAVSVRAMNHIEPIDLDEYQHQK